MLYLQACLWDDVTENGMPVGVFSKINGFSFETVLPGGFGVASFNVRQQDILLSSNTNGFLGSHCVVFDTYGRRIYEGRVATVDVKASLISFRVSGYYSHASDLTHGVVYPVTTPKSISAIVRDSIALTDLWSQDLTEILTTTQDITPQDFTGEKKIKDAIEEVLKFGSDDTVPVPLHFAIWENRRAYLFKEKLLTDTPDWRVYRKNFSGGSDISISVSTENLYNKIQVLYDDPDIGQTFTNWFEDATSQGLYGVREGSINIGGATSTLATLVGDLAIAYYAYPTYTATLGLQGLLKNAKNGMLENPYMVRAGHLISLDDYDLNVVRADYTRRDQFFGRAIVGRTSYNSVSNSVSLNLGTGNKSMDILLARIGMSSGSIS